MASVSSGHAPRRLSSKVAPTKITSVVFAAAALLMALVPTPSCAFSPSTRGGVVARDDGALRATWSNGQAIQEYNDFLSSGRQRPEELEDGPSVVVAKNPDSALANAILRMGLGDDVLLAPGDELPSHLGKGDDQRESYPVYLCLEPSELQEALADHLFGAWDERKNDIVYVSPIKGNLEPTLRMVGLPRDTTSQLLVSFTTPSKESGFVPMDTSLETGLDAQGVDTFAFESVACGRWKDAVRQRLERSQLRCRAAFYRDWRRSMWERSVFDAVFHLVGACADAARGDDGEDGGRPLTLAGVADSYSDDASEMVWQLSTMLRGSNAIALTYGFEERMFEYARESGKDVPCALRADDWPHVNGVFLDTSLKGLNMGFGDPAPLHTEYVRFAERAGLLKDVGPLELPPESDDAERRRPDIMRRGNLRADGVI